MPPNPPRGVRGVAFSGVHLVQPLSPWGVRPQRCGRPGSDRPRRPAETAGGEEFNHEKAARAWRGQSRRRRCRTAQERLLPRGKPVLLGSTGRNRPGRVRDASAVRGGIRGRTSGGQRRDHLDEQRLGRRPRPGAGGLRPDHPAGAPPFRRPHSGQCRVITPLCDASPRPPHNAVRRWAFPAKLTGPMHSVPGPERRRSHQMEQAYERQR